MAVLLQVGSRIQGQVCHECSVGECRGEDRCECRGVMRTLWLVQCGRSREGDGEEKWEVHTCKVAEQGEDEGEALSEAFAQPAMCQMSAIFQMSGMCELEDQYKRKQAIGR